MYKQFFLFLPLLAPSLLSSFFCFNLLFLLLNLQLITFLCLYFYYLLTLSFYLHFSLSSLLFSLLFSLLSCCYEQSTSIELKYTMQKNTSVKQYLTSHFIFITILFPSFHVFSIF